MHTRSLSSGMFLLVAVLAEAATALSHSRESSLTVLAHGPAGGAGKGDLTLRGQSRPVEVHYRAELGAGGVTKVQGALQLDIRDFEIKSPSYLGVTVAPVVEVKVELAMDGT